MPHRTFTSIATLTEALARTLETYQIDPRELFARHGLTPEPFRDPDARIRVTTMDRIWLEAAKLTKDPLFGFEVGKSFHATNLHAIGYAWLASATLREGFHRLIRYRRLIATNSKLNLVETGDELVVHLNEEDVDNDFAFAAIVEMCRDVTHPDFAPLGIRMVRPPPPGREKVEEFFRCAIEFRAADDVLKFTAASVDEPLRRHNPALARAADTIAEEHLATLEKGDVVDRVRMAITASLLDGEPSRKAVADELAMSERTLARRLAKHDLSFTGMVEAIRLQLAKDYLRESRFSVTDVAFLLGFSDQSNFARAFKRWTSESPTEFRARAIG